jgi:hypothetical protein
VKINANKPTTTNKNKKEKSNQGNITNQIPWSNPSIDHETLDLKDIALPQPIIFFICLAHTIGV